MISTPNSMSEREASEPGRTFLLESYRMAIRDMAQYAVELDPVATSLYRNYLQELANSITGASEESLLESRSAVRGLLREYRDNAARHLGQLRQELSDAAAALEQIPQALSQTDGDHELQLRKAIAQLRGIPIPPDEASGDMVLAVASAIESNLEQARNQQKLTVSQLLIEIRLLHQRIDVLESAASVDRITQLLKREEMEERIKALPTSETTVLLLKAGGLVEAETQFNRAVMYELTGAFTKRLRNCLPPETVIGRWSAEGFVAILHGGKTESTSLGERLSESLTGSYACVQLGKPVRPVIYLQLEMIDREADSTDIVLEKIAEFLGAA
jgi:GGDEF domain-containing protein